MVKKIINMDNLYQISSNNTINNSDHSGSEKKKIYDPEKAYNLKLQDALEAGDLEKLKSDFYLQNNIFKDPTTELGTSIDI